MDDLGGVKVLIPIQAVEGRAAGVQVIAEGGHGVKMGVKVQHTHALLVAGAQLTDQRIGDGVIAAESDGHTAGIQDLADPLPHGGEAVLIAAVLDGDIAVVAAAHIVEGIEVIVGEITHIAGGDGADGLGGNHAGGEAAIGTAALKGHTHDRKVILLQFLHRFGGGHPHKGGDTTVNFIWDDTGLIDGRYRFQVEHTPLSRVTILSFLSR